MFRLWADTFSLRTLSTLRVKVQLQAQAGAATVKLQQDSQWFLSSKVPRASKSP